MSDRRLIDGAAYTVDEFSAELLRLRADLAACQKRAAKAEQERDEARDECGGQAQMAADAIKRANDECAAARAQRDSLRGLLEEIASRLESGDISYAQGCLLAKRAREASE